MMLEQRPDGGGKHEDIWGRSAPGRGIACTKGLGHKRASVCEGELGGEARAVRGRGYVTENYNWGAV